MVVFAYNTHLHARLVRQELPKLIEAEHITQKKQYDKSYKEVEYQHDQKVLKNSDVNYKIALTLKGKETTETIHVDRLKPYYEYK
ncbi:Uncharacterized protein FWK35_00028753 [Aphis craccivora]|uniref:Integrase p58-like C-terminal domain-containing protein n=1 Tax=Aphis craccivora TaxID=307492 RepID=A0A6G0VVZ7_APHCR|nr:Uncharacterized protein FWK35_00028753 [Aphis craccivora]